MRVPRRARSLLLIYVSGLFAIGFSPIVRLIERQKVLPIGTKRLPRWLAILVLYLGILGIVALVGFLIFPPLVHQAQRSGRALPDMFDRGQEFLIDKGMLKEHLTLQRSRRARRPSPSGGRRRHGRRRRRQRRRRHLRRA